VEYDVNISSVLFSIFVLCELFVERHVIERLSGWKLLRPRLCCSKCIFVYYYMGGYGVLIFVQCSSLGISGEILLSLVL
jgi:TctA family transporter